MLVPADVGVVRFDFGKTVWLWSMLAGAAVRGVGAATPVLVAASLLLTFLSLCIGHSVGLHRGVIHATYTSAPVVRWRCCLCGRVWGVRCRG
jgi:hypothetical protein